MQKCEIDKGEKAEKRKGENVHGTQNSEVFSANDECNNENREKDKDRDRDSAVRFVGNGNRKCLHFSSNIINLKNEKDNEAKGNESVEEDEMEEYNKGNMCQQPAVAVLDGKEMKVILTDSAAEHQTIFPDEDVTEGSMGSGVKKEDRHCFHAPFVLLHPDISTGKSSSSTSITVNKENTDPNADQICDEEFSSRYSLFNDLKTLHQKMCNEPEQTDEPASLKHFFLERVEFAARQVLAFPFLHEELRGLSKEETLRYEVIRLASFSRLNELKISPKCKHANFEDVTNVPIQTKNYTLLDGSTEARSMQGILQQTKDDGRSTAPPLMSMPDSGFESAADPLESREPSSTLEKTQSHLYNHADEKSDGLEGSSLPVPSLKGATTAVSSFSSKAGLEGYTEPPGGRSEKSSNYNSGPPPVYNVYTTLMSHADTPGLEGKRFPVQAQQPAAVIHPYPYPESGRLSSSGTSPPVIPEPSTPGLDMMLAASTGDSVRCFYCGITLREWKHGDDPWEVHIVARFSCAYVKAVKGEDFILQTLISHSRNTACCLLEMHGSRHPLLHGSISRVLELFVETTTMHRQYKLHQDLANHHSGDPHFGG
ncbi:hypothetical protein C0Q70_11364 [Pomacea canaliculata]|uniref:Uncharacterized protein n=1 Tax=Pomacea canaliculata TaxID=400727 RepID=A0A2T7P5R7_POMCA|nr:hypothetical protein C0Q70_11364 [Pomacea canaliculata]